MSTSKKAAFWNLDWFLRADMKKKKDMYILLDLVYHYLSVLDYIASI